MLLNNKIALVTGGSGGIGQAITNALQQAGCQVLITYNTHPIHNAAVTEYQVDLSSEETIKELFQTIKKKFGHLDILVNNAAVPPEGEPFDIQHWKNLFAVDLFAAVSCVRESIPLMQKGGRIINISSIYSEDKAAYVGLPALSAVKAALNNFTRTTAKRLAPNILVNAIAPGYVLTPLWGAMTPEKEQKNGREQLINRFIKPEEVASLTLEIIKNDAMTGEVVVIDGGLSLKTV